MLQIIRILDFFSVLAVSDVSGLTELRLLQEEYKKLQNHLTDIEVKYQCELATSRDEDGDQKFAYKLQIMVTDLFNKDLYSDLLILLADGSSLYGHKLILSARSGDWSGIDLQQVDTLYLRDIRYDVAYAMMKWVYTDEISTDVDDVFLIKLLQAAIMFNLEALHTRCQKAMISCMNVNNCYKFYKISEETVSPLLQDYCLEFTAQSLTKSVPRIKRIMQSDIEEDTECESNENHDDNHDYYKENHDDNHDYYKENHDDNHDDCVEMIESDQLNNCNKNDVTTKQSVENARNIKNRYTCYICKKMFPRSYNLNRHLKLHPSENTDDSVTAASSKVQVVKKTFACSLCDRSYERRFSLKQHMRIHTGDRPYRCDVCGKTFTQRVILKSHSRSHDMFKCAMCPKSFKKKCDLDVHAVLHSGQKPYKCDVCGKTFIRSTLLKRHNLCHTREKLYACDVCGKEYTYSESLKAHKRTHTGEIPFVCDYCGKYFNSKSNLVQHRRLHTGEKPYNCGVCGKQFFHTSALHVHKRVHSGERPYQCDVCGKKFINASGLQLHKRSHSGEKPYQCNTCGRTFSHGSHLTRHKKIHERVTEVL